MVTTGDVEKQERQQVWLSTLPHGRVPVLPVMDLPIPSLIGTLATATGQKRPAPTVMWSL